MPRLLRFFSLIFILFLSSLKGEDIALLLHDLKAVQQIDREVKDALPMHYNHTLMGGYFNMPSACMNTEGNLAVGYASIPPYHNYGVTFQLFDRAEFSLNYRIFSGIPDPMMGKMGFGDVADRGANAKVALLKTEDGFPYLPEIALGVEDFYGTRRFYSSYIVMTKSFIDYNIEASLGWGKGRIKGFFGGVSFLPFRQINIKGIKDLTFHAEWDAIDYKHHFEEHKAGREIKNRVNVGVSTILFGGLQLGVSSLRGKEISVQASLNYNFGQSKGLIPKIEDPPFYQSPINEEPIGALRSEKELSAELACALKNQKLILFQSYLITNQGCGKTLWLKVINMHYRVEKKLKERIEGVLATLVPNDIVSVSVVIEADGILTHQYTFHVENLKQFQRKEIDEFALQTLTPMQEPTLPPNPYEGSLIYHRTKRAATFRVQPRCITFFGSSTGKFKYSLGVIGGVEGFLFDQTYYKIQAAYNIKSSIHSVGDVDKVNPSKLPNVRSDTVRYFQGNTIALDQAYLQKGFTMGKGWYGRVSLGYFEPAYGGVAGELLYYPVASNWAIGVEAAGVLKRSYDGINFTTKIREFDGSKFRWKHFIGNQYFLNLYYDFKPLQIDFKVRLGTFLGKDSGVSFEVGRYYPSGMRVSFWYDRTTAHDVVNGKNYHNRGIAFTIPLDLFSKKSSRAQIGYALAVWLRDSGAISATGKGLYSTLQTERSSQ